MTSSDSASDKTSHLGLPHYCGVDSTGRSGGLLLRWDNSIVLTTLILESHFILCKLSSPGAPCTNDVKYVLFIYGEARFEYRQALWNLLSSKIFGLSPLLILGDFNQVELFDDKLGGKSFIRGQSDFTTWKISNGLSDVPFSGPRFTWMNNQHNGKIIMERLDRAYANQKWFTLFPSTSISHLSILVSDHAPVILSLSPFSKPRKRPYRLDNCYGSSLYLAMGYKSSYSNGINWSEIEADLDLSAASIVDDYSASLFQHLRSTRLQLMRNQRLFWVQRSKIKAEVLDGYPTRFLFNRVKQRATKHRIMALRTSDGVWLHSPASVTDEIVNYFTNLLCNNSTNAHAGLEGFIHLFLSTLNLPKLGPVECSLLQAHFSENDILLAL
ncbi:uncharacterized protein LOC141607770 [Silene latifolia]|uniref:uncharacterized protein LOC141607770 n=1 Tax=Silene latifolia TaxID=37657 RepID=UPI003D786C06